MTPGTRSPNSPGMQKAGDPAKIKSVKIIHTCQGHQAGGHQETRLDPGRYEKIGQKDVNND